MSEPYGAEKVRAVRQAVHDAITRGWTLVHTSDNPPSAILSSPGGSGISGVAHVVLLLLTGGLWLLVLIPIELLAKRPLRMTIFVDSSGNVMYETRTLSNKLKASGILS